VAGLDFPPHPFWDWSLETYARDRVSPACVGLQDRHGLDVNLLLYALWRATRTAVPLDAAGLAGCDAAVARWRDEVVVPLRGVRRDLKRRGEDAPLSEGLRQRVKALELDAEHLEQLMLATTGPDFEAPPDAEVALPRAAAGVCACLTRLGTAVGAADRAALATLVGAALPTISRSAVDNALVAALAESSDSA